MAEESISLVFPISMMTLKESPPKPACRPLVFKKNKEDDASVRRAVRAMNKGKMNEISRSLSEKVYF